MSDFVLYNYFRSSTSYRIRIQMNLKNIVFDYKPVHLVKNGGEQFSSDYKKLNPASEVPTLVHKGYVIAQSMAIAEYLDSIVPEPRLIPADPKLAGQVRQFCEHINSGIHPFGNHKVHKYLIEKMGLNESQKEQFIHEWFKRGFETLENLLKTSDGVFCFGNQVSLADCFLVPAVVTAQRFKLPMESFSKALEISDRCMKIKAFLDAHPFRQIDTPEDLRIG